MSKIKHILGQYYVTLRTTALEQAVRDALLTGCRKATVYVSDKIVATATARFRPDRRSKRHEYVVKMGAPNFVERRYIRICKQAGMAFPLKNTQLKWWPKKKR